MENLRRTLVSKIADTFSDVKLPASGVVGYNIGHTPVAYKELFPYGNWTIFEHDRITLERAIDFWNNEVSK